VVRSIRPAYVLRIVLFLSSRVPFAKAEEPGRIKVAEGEYQVTVEGDLGIGPMEIEVFHFRESWTLWRGTAGEYVLEGKRTFESPMGSPHENQFTARLTHAFELLEVQEFAPLRFRPHSGPLRCAFLSQQLQCDAQAQDQAQAVDVTVPMDRPYGLLCPLSPFSLAGLTRHASANGTKPSPVQVVQLEEISGVIPVLPIRSDGLIRSLGQSQVAFTVPGKSWYAEVYELKAAPVRKMVHRKDCFWLRSDPVHRKAGSRRSDSSSLQNFEARQRRLLADLGGAAVSLQKGVECVRGQQIQ
jgi:hypothetical protein